MLGNRGGNAYNICFLKGVLANVWIAYLTSKAYHWNRIHIGCSNTCNQIGSTRARGSKADSYLASGSGITVCSVHSTLLVRGQNMIYFILIFIKAVVNVEYLTSGVAENGVHSLLDQRFYKYVSSGKDHHFTPSSSFQ